MENCQRRTNLLIIVSDLRTTVSLKEPKEIWNNLLFKPSPRTVEKKTKGGCNENVCYRG